MLLNLALRLILATVALLSSAAGLSACGQKGPLFIPDTPAAEQRATLPVVISGGMLSKPSAVEPATSAAPIVPSATPNS